jgi:hypothetical protein
VLAAVLFKIEDQNPKIFSGSSLPLHDTTHQKADDLDGDDFKRRKQQRISA